MKFWERLFGPSRKLDPWEGWKSSVRRADALEHDLAVCRALLRQASTPMESYRVGWIHACNALARMAGPDQRVDVRLCSLYAGGPEYAKPGATGKGG